VHRYLNGLSLGHGVVYARRSRLEPIRTSTRTLPRTYVRHGRTCRLSRAPFRAAIISYFVCWQSGRRLWSGVSALIERVHHQLWRTSARARVEAAAYHGQNIYVSMLASRSASSSPPLIYVLVNNASVAIVRLTQAYG